MTTTAIRYATWGPVCGSPAIRHRSVRAANSSLARHKDACLRQGGYTDRCVYRVCQDGYLWFDDECTLAVRSGPGRQVRFRHGSTDCW